MSSHKHWETDKRYVLCDRTDCAISYSSPNGEIVGSSLVPQEAVDAATDLLKMFPEPVNAWDIPQTLSVAELLEAAAPHIAAKALRAAIAASLQAEHGSIGVGWLRRFANKLEADAAFTELVQLGQELEAGVTERLHGTDDTDRLQQGR